MAVEDDLRDLREINLEYSARIAVLEDRLIKINEDIDMIKTCQIDHRNRFEAGNIVMTNFQNEIKKFTEAMASHNKLHDENSSKNKLTYVSLFLSVVIGSITVLKLISVWLPK